MEAAVVGATVGATISMVLKNLQSFSVGEIGLLWNFNEDLQKLKDSVAMIGDFLEDAEMKQVAEKPVQRWLMKLEAVAFDADYIFDRLNYQLLRKKVETDHKMKKQVSSFFSTSNPISFHSKMARKIENINKELRLINQEARELGLQIRVAGAPARGARTDALQETDSFSVDPVFVGRENDVAKIVKMVTSSSSTEQLVSVLPIVGMGGLGKTTLIRKVYNDANIVSHFGERVWVHVGEDFDPVIVLKKTLESLTEENGDGSREVLLRKLQKSLRDKTYLLVLDNVWNVSNDKWSNLITSLRGISSVMGNMIMVTSRSGNVATIVKTLDIHELQVLSEDDCWYIIKAEACGGESIPSEFEITGANIAKRCGGLPLAAQVVASLLRGKSRDEWVSIEKNWLSSFGGDENTVSKILKLSFDNLPLPSLKKCFAFCSIMPKGSWIEKDEMIQLWMAEGYLQTADQTNMETVGNKLLHISSCNYLTHLAPRLGGGGVSLRKLEIVNCLSFKELPQDLHNLNALEKLRIWHCPNLKSIAYPSESERQLSSSLRHLEFLKCSGLTNLPCEMLESCALSLQRLWLTGSESLTNLPQVMSTLHKMPRLTNLRIKDVPKLGEVTAEIGSLRSLEQLVIGGCSDCWDYVSIKASLDRIFRALRSLRVLTLHGVAHWEGLPDQLQHLTTLHELYLIDFGIQELPEWLERLSSLKTLQLVNCQKLRSVPSKKAMQGLTKLNNLYINRCPILKKNLKQEGSDDSERSKVSHIARITVDWQPFSAHAK